MENLIRRCANAIHLHRLYSEDDDEIVCKVREQIKDKYTSDEMFFLVYKAAEIFLK